MIRVAWPVVVVRAIARMGAAVVAVAAVAAGSMAAPPTRAEPADRAGDDAAAPSWSHYGGSPGGGQYSAARQIDAGNVGRLVEAWRHHSGETGAGSPRGFSYQANPVLAEGRLYAVTGSAIAFALDPGTGAELWRFDAAIDRGMHYAETGNRGVTSWLDPDLPAGAPCRHRIVFGTLDARVIALDGATGQPCVQFGAGGTVDLGIPPAPGGEWINYAVTSPPVVVGDVLVVGSAIGDNRGVDLEPGIVRGLDVRTGAERWRWDPIPRDPADPAAAGWQPAQRERARAANAWPPLSADPALGLVYVPTGSPSPDFYGGERLGDNRHANSLVALHAADGRVAWSRQLVHHDIWDYDLPAQPALVEVRRRVGHSGSDPGGRPGVDVPAVLQVTKMGLLFAFDRRNGEPLFAIEERPVPASDVPGEQASPTQPFPVAPPPLVRTAPLSADDAWGLAWIDRVGCAEALAAARSDGIYTPPSLRGTVVMPGWAGGANWGGVAFSPGTQRAVVFVMDTPMRITLLGRAAFEQEVASDRRAGSEYAVMRGTPYGMRREPLLSMFGVPCTAPPWGRLVAVDLDDGTIAWERPLGTTAGVLPGWLPEVEFGMPGMGGPIVTAGGLVFIGAAMDPRLRAFDLATGEPLWAGDLPAGGQATPMTYIHDGRQYVVIAAGGHVGLGTARGDALVAFALPEAAAGR